MLNSRSISSSTSDSRTQSAHSAHLSPKSSRREIEKLTPTSPMSDFKETARRVSSKVSRRTGGSDSRRRDDILAEMRRDVGLPPLQPPLGIPVNTDVKIHPHQVVKMRDESNTSDAKSAPRSATDTLRDSNSLGLSFSPGALHLSGITIVTDHLGRRRLTYRFTGSGLADLSWTCDPLGAAVRPSPPPESTFLGVRDHDGESSGGPPTESC